MKPVEVWNGLLEKAESARSTGESIAIVCHVNPDGDALGSAFGVQRMLQLAGYEAEVCCESALPKTFYNILKPEELHREPAASCGMLIAVDCSERHRMGGLSYLAGTVSRSVLIDHHEGDDCFAELTFRDSTACATAEILTRIFREAGLKPDMRAAKLLLWGISTDSGHFSYSSADERALSAAAWLMGIIAEGGSNMQQLYSDFYPLEPVRKAKLLALLYNRMRFEFDDTVSTGWVDKYDLIDTCTTEEDTEGFVERLRDVAGVKLAIFARPCAGGAKISLRSSGAVDCFRLAGCFGGGGHVCAAGCSLMGKTPEEAVNAVLHLYGKLYGKY